MTRGAILAIGDELICGYRLDTNSQFISRRLASVPLDVAMHLTVGDDWEAIHNGLRIALGAADVLVITGGLGPTEDDLTRQAVAAFFGLELVENAEAMVLLEERFARRGRVMPESNRIQAQVPAGSQIIFNDRGTASGFYLAAAGKHIFVTPGIPFEMEGMVESFILARLQALVGGMLYQRRAALKVYGLAESAINERIKPMMVRGRNPLLGLLPHRGTITIEVVASSQSAQEAQALMEADVNALRAELGRYVISEDERELPQVVADLLLERGLSISAVEWGTGGLLTARLTEPEEAHRWLRSSFTFSSEGQVQSWMGGNPLPEEDLVLAMADAARRAGHTDIGMATGPVTVPEDGPQERPYAVMWAAVNLAGRATCRKVSFSGDRVSVREWAADAALGLLRQCLLEQSEGVGA